VRSVTVYTRRPLSAANASVFAAMRKSFPVERADLVRPPGDGDAPPLGEEGRMVPFYPTV
jgi:hypothetical protein